MAGTGFAIAGAYVSAYYFIGAGLSYGYSLVGMGFRYRNPTIAPLSQQAPPQELPFSRPQSAAVERPENEPTPSYNEPGVPPNAPEMPTRELPPGNPDLVASVPKRVTFAFDKFGVAVEPLEPTPLHSFKIELRAGVKVGNL